MALPSSSKRSDYFALATVLLSLISIAMYIHGIFIFGTRIVSYLMFWSSLALLSASLMYLWFSSQNEKILLSAILISAFVIASLPILRFYFYGADLLGEYFVADTTREVGRWLPGRITDNPVWLVWDFAKPTELLSRYFASTGVTIVPAILSEVTGASTRIVLWVLLATTSTMVVLVSYLITKSCLGRYVATLSSIVFISSTFYLSKFPNILREDMGLLFLLLAVLSLVVGGRKNIALAGAWLILLPMSHYGLFLFAPVVLLLLLSSNKVYEYRLTTRIMKAVNPRLLKVSGEPVQSSSSMVLYSAIAGFAWLMFVAYVIFASTLYGFNQSWNALLGLTPPRTTSLQSHILFSDLGPFHTAVQWLERAMALAGLALSLKMFKTRKAISFVFLGGGLLAIVVVLGGLPVVTTLFDLDRAMQLALIGFAAFIAVTLVKISGRHRYRVILTFILVTLILFESVQLPILYSGQTEMSRADYVFSLTNIYSFYQLSDFHYADWVSNHISPSAVFASDSNGCRVLLVAKRICVQPQGSNLTDTIALLESGKTDYYQAIFFLHDYMWFSSTKGTTMQLNSTQIEALISSNHLNRVYDDSRVTNFAYVPS